MLTLSDQNKCRTSVRRISRHAPNGRQGSLHNFGRLRNLSRLVIDYRYWAIPTKERSKLTHDPIQGVKGQLNWQRVASPGIELEVSVRLDGRVLSAFYWKGMVIVWFEPARLGGDPCSRPRPWGQSEPRPPNPAPETVLPIHAKQFWLRLRRLILPPRRYNVT
jgi:hypothetical protein